MTSPHAETALMQVVVVLAAVVFLSALAAAVTTARNWAADRRKSRARLDRMPKPSAADMTLGRAELFAAVRAERGERRVG